MLDAIDGGLPQARAEHLLTRVVPDGLLVYDTDRHQAHSLNQTAALVWQRCDGRTTVAELAALLQSKLNLPADEELIWLALSHLEQAHLLREGVAAPHTAVGISRRAALRKLGMASGMAALVPLVETLAAPPASAAISPADPPDPNTGAPVTQGQIKNTANTATGSQGQGDPNSNDPPANDPPGGTGNNNSQDANSRNQGNGDPPKDSPSDPPGGNGSTGNDSQDQGNRRDTPGGPGQAVLQEGSG